MTGPARPAPTDDRLSYNVTVRWPDGRTLISLSSTEPAQAVAGALREVAAIVERVAGPVDIA